MFLIITMNLIIFFLELTIDLVTTRVEDCVYFVSQCVGVRIEER